MLHLGLSQLRFIIESYSAPWTYKAAVHFEVSLKLETFTANFLCWYPPPCAFRNFSEPERYAGSLKVMRSPCSLNVRWIPGILREQREFAEKQWVMMHYKVVTTVTSIWSAMSWSILSKDQTLSQQIYSNLHCLLFLLFSPTQVFYFCL